MKQRNLLILACIIIILVVILSFQQPKETIKIGFIGPLSGDASIVGKNEADAIDLALEDIQNEIFGKQVQIITEDGKCNGKDAATAAQKLVNVDKVKIILGGICSAETLGAAPITESNKVILFSAFSSSPDISDAGEYIFRTTLSDIQCAKPLLPYFAEYKKLAMITENTDYSQGIRKDFIPKLQELGVEIVADEIYAPGERDFKGYLMKIKQENPETLFVNPGTSPAAAEMLIKQAKEMGLDIQLYGNFIIGSGDIIKNIPEALEGAIFYDAQSLDPNNQKTQNFIFRYKEKYGNPYSEWEVAARYDSVFVIKNAIEHCKGVNTECIKKYLYNMPLYNGTVGLFNFDNKGDVKGMRCSLFQIKNGSRVLIISPSLIQKA